MNTVSLRVSYRPIRIGMCVAESAIEDLRKAIRFNSTLWGGKFNPIIPIGTDSNFADTLIRTFRVDALFAVSETPLIANFIERTRFLPWPDAHRQLYVSGIRGPLPAFLDIYHPMRELAEERAKEAIPTLDVGVHLPNSLTRMSPGNSVLADVLLCTLGDYPDRTDCPIDYGAVAERLLGTEFLFMTPETGLPGTYWTNLSPIAVTSSGLLVYKRHGGWSSPGVFVGSPTLFSDLVTFWNLRAAGIEVLFFPDAEEEQRFLKAGAKSWFEHVRKALRDGSLDPFNQPAVWCTREDQNWDALSQTFEMPFERCIVRAVTWNGSNVRAPNVHFEEHPVLGTIDETDQQIAIAFALPPKPFSEVQEASFQQAIVTVHPLIDPKPTAGTFHYPYIPELNEFYGRRAHFDRSCARVEPEGLGIVINLHKGDLILNGISPLALITELFNLAGIAAKQSSAGKVAMRVIQHMGGLEHCRVFKVKGVRDLLHEFGLSRTFSHKQALARIGPGFQAYKRLFIESREHRDLEPQDVFLYLVKKRIIRPGMELECVSCQLSEWFSLNDLADTVTCPNCGSHFDSGPQLRDGAWLYRVSGLFARTRDHEGSLPVTLALLQTLRCLDTRGMTWLTGMDLSWNESGRTITGEADLVVITQNYEDSPELIVGECKTNMELDADQVDGLIAATRRFTATGVKTYVMFAKAGGQFTDRELNLIDERQTRDFNFILLTPNELEPYDPYENIKSDKIRHAAPLTLGEWAGYSRELYLRSKPPEILERNFQAGPNTSS